MIPELNIASTYFPEERLPINRWFRFISGKDLNLDQVNTNTFLGLCFTEMYKRNPDQAVKEILEAAKDNEAMVIKVIGLENYKKIL